MKRFQQLEIHKDHQSLIALLDRMKTAQNAVFFYDQEMSDMVNKNTKGDPICAEFVYYVFRTNDDGLYRAQVFLSLLNTELKVINITSSNPAHSELGITRYNIILHCFFHNFIAHFIDASYTDCIFLTGENMSLRDYLGTDVYNALERWATTCNRHSPPLTIMTSRSGSHSSACCTTAARHSIRPTSHSGFLKICNGQRITMMSLATSPSNSSIHNHY